MNLTLNEMYGETSLIAAGAQKQDTGDTETAPKRQRFWAALAASWTGLSTALAQADFDYPADYWLGP